MIKWLKTAIHKQSAFPRAMKDSPDFSFSGLKTSFLTMLKKRGRDFSAEELPDIVASYQEAIVDVLVEKTIRAAEENNINRDSCLRRSGGQQQTASEVCRSRGKKEYRIIYSAGYFVHG